MSQGPDPDRLRALEAKLSSAKKELLPEEAEASQIGQVEAGWRMVLELMTGIGIGAGLGYGADVLFGTLPIFLMVLTLLGFAAGVRTMLRSAQEIQEKNARAAALEKEDGASAPAKDDGASAPAKDDGASAPDEKG